MKASSISDIKQEINALPAKQVSELCLRLARFKKENKELLTYLLFEANDEQGFVDGIKAEIDAAFEVINVSQLFFAKKSVRRIVRLINKYSRYSNERETELQLRLHFCQRLKGSGIPVRKNAVINNLYISQLKKIAAGIAVLHEDLQYEYNRQWESLEK